MRDMTEREFAERLAAHGWEPSGTSRTDAYFDTAFNLHRVKNPVDVPNFRYRITDPVVLRAIELKLLAAHRRSLYGLARMLGRTMLRRQTLAHLVKRSEEEAPRLRAKAEQVLAKHFLREAAEDLLAAARRAVPAVEQLCTDQHEDNECWAVLAALGAAIAKAEGREVEAPRYVGVGGCG